MQISGRFHDCEYNAGQAETLAKWREVHSASIGSAQFAQALATICTSAKQREEESLKKVVQVLGWSENIAPEWYSSRQQV